VRLRIEQGILHRGRHIDLRRLVTHGLRPLRLQDLPEPPLPRVALVKRRPRVAEGLLSRAELVPHDDIMSTLDQAVHAVRADKTGTARYHHFHRTSSPHPSDACLRS